VCVGRDRQTVMDIDEEEDAVSVASSSHRSFADYSHTSSGNVSSLTQKLYHALAHDETITSKQHMRAAQVVRSIQLALVGGAVLGRTAQTLLMCTISSLYRRIVRMDEQSFFETDEHLKGALKVEKEDFMNTATLVFILISTGDLLARGRTPIDGDAAQRELDECMKRSLWLELCKPPNKKRTMDEATTSVEGEEIDPSVFERSQMEHLVGRPMLAEENSSGWSRALYEPGATAGAAVRLSSSLLTDAFDHRPFRDLMITFARCSAQQMCVHMLRSQNDRDFLTLSARRFAMAASSEREEALVAIVQAGESELGQQVLRDMMLSFLLPKSVVGVRRTLALSRESATAATAGYPFITEIAHQTAMQGCEFVWKNSDSELKRLCALLSGIAMLTTKGTDDLVRKATAFSGLVQLPFLETVPPSPKQPRLAMVPTNRSWVLYSLSAKGTPVVELSKRGFDGLIFSVLAFRDRGM